MLRRFNYTGRKRIAQDDVPILLTGNGPLRGFTANLTGLSKYDLAPEGRVFVEAYERAAYMRFDFGTIANLTPPSADARALTEFEGSDGIRFRVKVTDTAHDAQLLAEADGILPLSPEESEQNKLPLLPVRSDDLGHELWKVEFPESTQDRPTLVVNINAGERTAFVRSPAFMSLASPAILREILTRILQIDGEFDTDDDDDWHCMWLQFGRRLLPTSAAPPDDAESKQLWVDDVVEAFCNHFNLLTRFKESEDDANVITS